MVIKPEECAAMTDEELLEILKQSPDFEKFVLPVSWHKKFPDLPKATCSDTKTFIKESPWMKKHQQYYVGGGKVETLEAKEGGLRPILPAPEIPSMTLIQNSFSDAPTDQIADERPQDYPEMKVNSIEPTETKTQG
jgi:hypothetical protein